MRPPESLFTLLTEEAASDFGMAPVDNIEFLQSELTRQGARYSTLETFALAPRAP
jgi:2'-5' RNA ligase